MTRHRLPIALAAAAGLAMPGIALADDDDDTIRSLRSFVAPQFHVPVWGWDDSRRRDRGYRIRRDDDDDRRRRRGDGEDDDRRGRWGDGDDD